MTRTLTDKELIAMNVYLIKSGSPAEPIGVKEPTALNMCVESVNQSVYGKELYPTLEEKAAILYINLIQKHCFHNGNKRTAHMALTIFLKLNGRKWIMDVDPSVELAVSVATWDGNFDTLKSCITKTIIDNTKAL